MFPFVPLTSNLKNDATVTPLRTFSSPLLLVVRDNYIIAFHLSAHRLRARVRLSLQVVLLVTAQWRGTVARTQCVSLFHFTARVFKAQPRLADHLRCPITLKPLVQIVLTYVGLFCEGANHPLTGAMCSVWTPFLISLWVYASTNSAACLPGGRRTQPCVSSCPLCYSNYYNTDFNSKFYKLWNISAERSTSKKHVCENKVVHSGIFNMLSC